MKNIVTEYFAENLHTLSQKREFGKISKDDFLLYVRLADLSVEKFAHVATKWIQHDEDARITEFKEILPCYQAVLQGHDEGTEINQMQEISSRKWFAVKKFAKKHACPKIEGKADELILEHFSSIFTMAEFKTLDKSDVLKYIKNRSPEDIPCTWEAVVSWVNHDVEHKESFPQLFKSLDFDHAPADFLQKVVAEESLVEDSSTCKDILISHLLSKVAHLQTVTEKHANDIEILYRRL